MQDRQTKGDVLTKLSAQMMRLGCLLLAFVIIQLAVIQLAQAAPQLSIESWRTQVKETRVLAENDVPLARQHINDLINLTPASATDVDRVHALNVLARIEVYEGKTIDAEKHIQEAVNLATQHKDIDGEIEALLNAALNLVNQGKLDELNRVVHHGLELAGKTRNPALRGEMMLRASMLYLRFGELEASGKFALQAMDIAEQDKNNIELMFAHQGLAIVNEQNGRHREAIEHFKKTRDLAQQYPSKLLVAGSLVGIGASTYHLGKNDRAAKEAETYHKQAYAIYQEVGAPIWLSFAKVNLANNLIWQQRYAEALPLMTDALNTCDEADIEICKTYVFIYRSNLYSKMGDKILAKKDATEAYRLAKEYPLSRLQVETAERLAESLAATGDFSAAYPIAREALQLKEKMRAKQTNDYANDLINRYQNETKQRKINQLEVASKEQELKLQKHALEQHRLLFLMAGLTAIVLAAVAFLVMSRRSNATLKQVNHQLEESKGNLARQSQILQSILNSIGDGVSVADRTGKLMFMNPAAEKILGVAASSSLVRSDVQNGHDVFYKPDLKSIYAAEQLPLQRALRGEFSDNEDLYLQTLGGSGKWLEVTARPVVDTAGERQGGVVVFSDVTQRKTAEDALEFLAHHDTLTRLPNRQLLRERFHAIINQNQAEALVALIFLDLDNFKLINDSLGHSVGDQVLNVLAQRLEQLIPETALVSREGGDEFVIVMNQITHTDQVRVMMDELMTEVHRAIDVGNHTLYVTCCAGISLYPQDSRDFESLRKHADTALYSAKDFGRAHYLFFQKEMDVRANARMAMHNDLRRAIDKKEFILHFQPQLSTQKGDVIGIEALLRWRKPDQLIPPDEFIPIAEQSGLIVPIGEWVLREACMQALTWHEKGWRLNLAVNISAVQILHRGFVDSVRAVLAETAFPADRLELEITESVLLDDSNVTLDVLRDLKVLGVRLALDDFGTGYSSLAYLKRITLDRLKIDRSFVRDITEDDEDAAIVKTIIQLGHNMGLSVVAEGVQTKEQRDFLMNNHCDYVQGYYFSLPMDVTATTQWLASNWK